MRARALVVGLLLALVTGLPGLSPVAASATASRLTATITFDKNWRDPQDSRLSWRVWRHDGRDRRLVASRSWRAGAGFTPRSTDACKRNDGWLPNGRYRPRLIADYWGSLIKGSAIQLGRQACADGTVRQNLFIHTEQGARNSQCADRKGDQPCRWEYPKINDYRSHGCIKLSPPDMRALFRAWRRHFDLGYDGRVRVRVIG
jgi:hypothetical protein